MKRFRIIALLVSAFVLWGVGVNAQYDDIYYNPDVNNRTKTQDYKVQQSQDYNYNDEADNGYDEFDDEAYDYYYTSRIRRFHRPVYGFEYYDPFYTDMYYYDPFGFSPMATVLIYDSPWSYNSWNRFNRFAFRSGFGFGMRRGFGYDPFYNPYWGSPSFAIYNNYYFGGSRFGYGGFGSPFGYSSWGSPYYGGGFGYGGYGGGLYCPPTWGGGYAYYTAANAGRDNNTTYGPRGSTGGVTTAPRTNLPRSTGDRTTTVTPRSTEGVNPTDRSATPNTGRVQPADRYSRDRYTQPGLNRGTTTTPDRSRTTTPSQDRYRIQQRPNATQTPRSRSYTPPSSATPRSSATPYTRDATRQAPSTRSYSPPSQSAPRSIDRSSPSPSAPRSIDRSSTPSRSSGTPSRSSGSSSRSGRNN